MTLEEKFETVVQRGLSLPKRPSNADLLLLYSLYKQATLGDNPHDKPTIIDMKSVAKHRAWNEQKGKSREKAMEEYIAKIEALEAAQLG